MKKRDLKPATICALFGVFFSIILLTITIILNIFLNYKFKNILFVTGIMSIFCGILSSFYGNSLGFSSRPFETGDYKYIANANFEAKDFGKGDIIKTLFSMISLIVAGVICVILNLFLT